MSIPDVLVQLLLRWFLHPALFVFTVESSVTVVVFVHMSSKIILSSSTVVTLGTFEFLFLWVCSFVSFKSLFFISKETTIQTLVVPHTLVYIPYVYANFEFISIFLITLRALVDLVWFNNTIVFPFYCRTLVIEEFSLSGKDSPTVISFTVKILIWKQTNRVTWDTAKLLRMNRKYSQSGHINITSPTHVRFLTANLVTKISKIFITIKQ